MLRVLSSLKKVFLKLLMLVILLQSREICPRAGACILDNPYIDKMLLFLRERSLRKGILVNYKLLAISFYKLESPYKYLYVNIRNP